MSLDAYCHCGAVHLAVPEPPTSVNECNCSICHRLGTLWAYYPLAAVHIDGPTTTYAWGERSIDFHRCAGCGCTTHWAPRDDGTRLGINARLFAPQVLAALPVRHSDNRARGGPPPGRW